MKHESDEKQQGIILFIKYPSQGLVKTRLEHHFSLEQICQLYMCFISDILYQLNQVSPSKIICFYPTDKLKSFENWLGSDYQFLPQIGDSFEDRMMNVFKKLFGQNYHQLLLIGGDIPDISVDIVNSAFYALDDADVVLGPSRDGGYYLIGLTAKSFSESLFENIGWGSSMVLHETILRVNKEKMRYYLLNELSDIDTYDDVIDYYHKKLESNTDDSATMTYLKTIIKEKKEDV